MNGDKMNRITSSASYLVLFVMSGCALLGSKSLTPSPGMRGRMVDNVYVSPKETFRLRIPPLSKTGAKMRDEVPSEGTLLLTLSDDLCREFIVSERPGILGDRTIEAWVDQNIVEPLKASGVKVSESKALKTRLGPVVTLRYPVTAGAPCVQTTVKQGKKVETKPDAEVGWYVFYHSGSFYRLIYVLGVGPEIKDSWFIRRAPVETVLAQFADGFEIIRQEK